MSNIDNLLSQLHNILSQMRYVKSGDIILSQDHNLKVDALWKVYDILQQLKAQPSTKCTNPSGISPIDFLSSDYFIDLLNNLNYELMFTGYRPSLFYIDDFCRMPNSFEYYLAQNSILTNKIVRETSVAGLPDNVLQSLLQKYIPISYNLTSFYTNLEYTSYYNYGILLIMAFKIVDPVIGYYEDTENNKYYTVQPEISIYDTIEDTTNNVTGEIEASIFTVDIENNPVMTFEITAYNTIYKYVQLEYNKYYILIVICGPKTNLVTERYITIKLLDTSLNEIFSFESKAVYYSGATQNTGTLSATISSAYIVNLNGGIVRSIPSYTGNIYFKYELYIPSAPPSSLIIQQYKVWGILGFSTLSPDWIIIRM